MGVVRVKRLDEEEAVKAVQQADDGQPSRDCRLREMVAAAVMAAISDQALMRHQYQRRMKTRPAPAPSASRNFQAAAMEAPWVCM